MRLTFINFEGEGEAVDAAVRAITEAFVRPREAQVIAVEESKALPAPAVVEKVKRAKRKKKAAPPQWAAGTQEGKPGPGELAIAALRGGPKTVREVLVYIQAHGIPEYTRAKTSGTLSNLKARGKARLSDEGRWHLL